MRLWICGCLSAARRASTAHTTLLTGGYQHNPAFPVRRRPCNCHGRFARMGSVCICGTGARQGASDLNGVSRKEPHYSGGSHEQPHASVHLAPQFAGYGGACLFACRVAHALWPCISAPQRRGDAHSAAHCAGAMATTWRPPRRRAKDGAGFAPRFLSAPGVLTFVPKPRCRDRTWRWIGPCPISCHGRP